MKPEKITKKLIYKLLLTVIENVYFVSQVTSRDKDKKSEYEETDGKFIFPRNF